MIAVIRGKLAQHGQADQVGHKYVGPVLPELVGALIGNDDTEQEGEQANDRYCIKTGSSKIEKYRLPAETSRVHNARGEGDGNFADEAEQGKPTG